MKLTKACDLTLEVLDIKLRTRSTWDGIGKDIYLKLRTWLGFRIYDVTEEGTAKVIGIDDDD